MCLIISEDDPTGIKQEHLAGTYGSVSLLFFTLLLFQQLQKSSGFFLKKLQYGDREIHVLLVTPCYHSDLSSSVKTHVWPLLNPLESYPTKIKRALLLQIPINPPPLWFP